MNFLSALYNVLMCLFYCVPGYIIAKMKKTNPDHLSTVSAILIYIGTPFLEVSSFLALDFSMALLGRMALFFVVTLLLQAGFTGLMALILRKRLNEAKYRILSSVSAMGNVGFFGLPIVRALLPTHPEVVAYAAVTMLSMNMLSFTVGVFCFTGDRKYMSLKSALFNPTTLGVVLGMTCFVFGLKNVFPAMLQTAIANVANMTMPLCMFLLGIRLAASPLRRAFTDKMAWLIAGLKLAVFPLVCWLVLLLLPLPEEMKAAAVILMATPCAAFALSLSEMYHSLPALSANCITCSTLCCFITIPLFTLLF